MEEKIHVKNFKDWLLTKERIEKRSYTPMIMKGDIWYLQVGINSGSEIDGKGDEFLRPVYVFKKINRDVFIGIPLTTVEGDFRDKVKITGKDSYLLFSQIKAFSVKRCTEFMESVPIEEQDRIKSIFHDIFCK